MADNTDQQFVPLYHDIVLTDVGNTHPNPNDVQIPSGSGTSTSAPLTTTDHTHLLQLVNTLVDSRLSALLPVSYPQASPASPVLPPASSAGLDFPTLQQFFAPTVTTATVSYSALPNAALTSNINNNNNGSLAVGNSNAVLTSQSNLFTQPHLFQQQQQINNQHQSELPAIPSKILKQIKNGEFVDFDTLLPSNIGRPNNSAVSLAFDGDGNISFHRNESTIHQFSKKAKVIDLNSWLMAWSRYFQASLVYRPHLVGQMLSYQVYISHLANDYSFSGWYTYDKAFRTFVSNNPTARWDLSNQTLYNLHLMGNKQPSQCYLCQSKDHLAPRCPSSFAAPASASSSFVSHSAPHFSSPRMPPRPGPRPRPPSFPRAQYFQPYPSLRQPFPAPPSSSYPLTALRSPFQSPRRCRRRRRRRRRWIQCPR